MGIASDYKVVVKIKKIFFIFFSFIGISQAACSSCKTLKTPFENSEFVSFELTVIDPDSSTFKKFLTPDSPPRASVFEIDSGYIRPGETIPDGIRNVRFFFRKDALPDGSNIFDKKLGDIIQVGKSANQTLDSTLIQYQENQPTPDSPTPIYWNPTSFDGIVKIIADDQVQFDLTFTDGIESRRVLGLYNFFSGTSSQELGNCD